MTSKPENAASTLLPVAAACVLLMIARLGLDATPATAQGLESKVTSAIAQYNENTAVPIPSLSDDQLRALLDGEVVKIRRQLDREATAERKSIVSYYLCDRPRDHVWVAAIDPHYSGSDRLTEVRIDGDGEGGATWYQHIDLPWPVQDRHWVIRTRKGTDLAQASNGRAWEHSWQLVTGGEAIATQLIADGKAGELKPKNVSKAVYLPANTGAWVMFALDDDRSMIVYHVTTVVGGSIPDSWIATFAYPQLDQLLRGVEAFSHDIVRHYTNDHEPVYSGAGAPIESLR